MWKVLCGLTFLMAFFYYVTLVLHALNIVRIGDKLGFRWRYLVPFYLWFEK